MQVIIEIYDIGTFFQVQTGKQLQGSSCTTDLGVEKRTSADRFGFTGHVSVFPGGLTG